MCEHNRHGSGCGLQRGHSRTGCGQDDIRRERDQFDREFSLKRGIAWGPANINPHVSTFGPTQFLKALPERCNASLAFRVFGSRTHEYTDPRNLLALLCPHRNRPYGRRAAEKCDELSPSHRRPRGSGRTIVTVKTGTLEGAVDVRFGSKADICADFEPCLTRSSYQRC